LKKKEDRKNWLVEKSNPLLSLAQSDFTLSEFKIIDAFLSRINSHDDSVRSVIFEKGELEELLGVTRILNDDLKDRLKNLFKTVYIKDDRKKDGFKLVTLFEKAEAYPDEDGLWKVELKTTDSAQEYIFNIDNIGYLAYTLRSIVNLKSRHSYVLYLYLLQNRFRKSWTVDLEQLKIMLKVDDSDAYKQYYRFNDLVLKKCKQELEERTDVRFDYEPVKTGRTVSGIQFTLTEDFFPKLDQAPQQPKKEISDPFIAQVQTVLVGPFNFTSEEIASIAEETKKLPVEESEKMTVLKKIFGQVLVYNSRKPVKAPYRYLLSSLSSYKPPVAKPKSTVDSEKYKEHAFETMRRALEEDKE